MAQFDVYALAADGQKVVDVQSDLLAGALPSRLVIPLFAEDFARWSSTRLAPKIAVGDDVFVLGTSLMTGIPKSALTRPIGSLADESYTILNAIDFLLTGV